MQKRTNNKYLHFTSKERNGIISLLLIILILAVTPVIYPLIFKEKKFKDSNFQNELAGLEIKQTENTKRNFSKKMDNENEQHYYSGSKNKFENKTVKGELFYFDPNTISTEEWRKLGLKEKTIATINKFISKGGKFRQAEDIKKIWGLHEEEVKRLIPFVKIADNNFSGQFKKPETIKEYGQKRSIEKVDINLADSASLTQLPGIGPRLSVRIINFRDKLGGFYSIDQVGETFGLPDSVFQKIKTYLVLNNKNLRQININSAGIEEFKLHPYIRYNLGNLIMQYRQQHGSFTAVSDIKKIMMVKEDIYDKVLPYLSVQ